MKEKEILKRLRNDEDYYGDFGKQFLSNSDVKPLTTRPRKFHAPVKVTQAMTEGRYYHQYILEKEKAKNFPIVDCTTRAVKVFKEYCADNNLGKYEVLLKKEAEAIEDMANYTLQNITFFDFINDPSAQYEVPAIGEIGEGVMWKGKADILTDKYVIDLKTSSDVWEFKNRALKYFYHTQAYIYQILFKKPVIFLVTHKFEEEDKNNKFYYALGLFTVSENTMGLAEQKVGQAVASWRKWHAPDSKEDLENWIINTEI